MSIARAFISRARETDLNEYGCFAGSQGGVDDLAEDLDGAIAYAVVDARRRQLGLWPGEPTSRSVLAILSRVAWDARDGESSELLGLIDFRRRSVAAIVRNSILREVGDA